MIPPELSAIYPNPPVELFGTPAVVFRDHRWTLPVLALAAERGLVRFPVAMISLDRHRDALVPARGLPELAAWKKSGGGALMLADIVANLLSPRDDDWTIAGMEAGILSDVARFRSEEDDMEPVTLYTDSGGVTHRIYHLGTFPRELSFKGALADGDHPAVKAGLWQSMGWDPRALRTGGGRLSIVLDIDLDYFTAPWGVYIIPFTPDIWRGEFIDPRSSHYADGTVPAEVFARMAEGAGVMTVACEPDFCGGRAGARKIFLAADRYVFNGAFSKKNVRVDYRPVYPSEGCVCAASVWKHRGRE